MKTSKFRSLFIRGAAGALLLQAVTLVSAQARPGDHVPSSVIRLDSAAHTLVDSFQRSLRKDYHKHSSYRAEQRFLNAAKTVESRAHDLRSNVEARRGSGRAQEDIIALRRAFNYLHDASRDVRLSERVRGDLYRVRSAINTVEDDRRSIYASATPRGHHDHDHGHDHDHDHDDDRRRGLPGILGRIFGD